MGNSCYERGEVFPLLKKTVEIKANLFSQHVTLLVLLVIITNQGSAFDWGEGGWEGGVKPDGLVILRNQNQTLLSVRIPAAVFISVIVYLPTLQFVTTSFFLKSARAYCTFYIYLAKPVSKVHVSHNRSHNRPEPRF